jgi:hypothetical protein
MFILHLISKFFRGVSPCSGSTLVPRLLVTESVFRPASTIKPPPVFRHRQSPYHLVQRCRHRSTNCPGTPTSRWDCPSTLCLVNIGATFSSPPPFHQVDIRHGYHHANLRVGAYKHPHHKLRFPIPRSSMARGMQQCRQESSWKRRGFHPHSPPGQGIVRGGRSGTTMPVPLTDTCHWRLYGSFDAHSQFKINDTYHRYQSLMHLLSILRRYQSASLGATRSVANTMLVWDTGASIGLTLFCSDFIDYLPWMASL